MSFSIEPKSGPAITQPPGAQSEAQSTAKERAIARLMSNSPHSMESKEAVLPVASESVDRQNNSSEVASPEASAPVAAEPAPVAEPEKPLSSEYAILARKEKQLRARDQQLRQRELALKASEDAKNAPAAKPAFDESKYISKQSLQDDLFGTLSNLGLTYDQITQQAVNAPTPEQVASEQRYKVLEAKLAALESEQAGTKKSWEDQQAESYKQAVNQIKAEANALVTHNPAFETIKETDSVGDVVELIERTFKEDGVLLTVEEASTQVEDYLVEEALKIARIKKIQQRLQPVAASQAAQATQKITASPQQQQLKTLTNQVASTRKLTSRERAILAAEGKLKK